MTGHSKYNGVTHTDMTQQVDAQVHNGVTCCDRTQQVDAQVHNGVTCCDRTQQVDAQVHNGVTCSDRTQQVDAQVHNGVTHIDRTKKMDTQVHNGVTCIDRSQYVHISVTCDRTNSLVSDTSSAVITASKHCLNVTLPAITQVALLSIANDTRHDTTLSVVEPSVVVPHSPAVLLLVVVPARAGDGQRMLLSCSS